MGGPIFPLAPGGIRIDTASDPDHKVRRHGLKIGDYLFKPAESVGLTEGSDTGGRQTGCASITLLGNSGVGLHFAMTPKGLREFAASMIKAAGDIEAAAAAAAQSALDAARSAPGAPDARP